MLETRVAGATLDRRVYLSDGDAGPDADDRQHRRHEAERRSLDTLDVERDARGRVVTDEFLRVRGRQNVWAGGDCAAIPHPDGGTCPPVALYAQQARHAPRAEPRPRGRGASRSSRTAGGRGCRASRSAAARRSARSSGIPLNGKLPWVIWRGRADATTFPSLGPPAASARRLADLAARRSGHRPDRAVGERDRLRRPPQRLPAGRDDRRAARGRSASSTSSSRARPSRRATAPGRRRRSAPATTSAASGSTSAAPTSSARERSSARCRCARTRRTGSRRCCSRPSTSSPSHALTSRARPHDARGELIARLAHVVSGRRTKWIVVGAWIVLLAVFAPLGLKLHDVTNEDVALPGGSQSHRVNKVLAKSFPGGDTRDARARLPARRRPHRSRPRVAIARDAAVPRPAARCRLRRDAAAAAGVARRRHVAFTVLPIEAVGRYEQ